MRATAVVVGLVLLSASVRAETDGAEDFTPDTGSPLIDAGIQVPTA